MKKALFLLLLLPFIGFSQNIVRWNSDAPTVDQSTFVSSQNIVWNGIDHDNLSWAGGWRINNLANNGSSAYNSAKYMEFRVTANNAKKFNPSAFKLTYSGNGDSSPRKMLLSYSKDNSTWTNLSAQDLITDNANRLITFSFPSSLEVIQNQTLYIRVYMYGSNSQYYTDFLVKNSFANVDGPTLTGTAATYSTVLLTADDNGIVTNVNTASAIDVLANDVNTTGATISVSTAPLHGTATVNSNNTITYTPAAGYLGTDTFRYKAVNGAANSTATVTLTVKGTTPTTGKLTGTYYVGDYGHFTTITQAVNYLNTNGVNGSVNFLLVNNAATKVYNTTNGETFPITINGDFQGNSNSNHLITFKPAPGKNVKIEALRPIAVNGQNDGGSWAVPAVFKLYGSDNIVFDGSNTANGTTRNMVIVNSSYAGNINHTTGADGDNNSNDYTDRAVVWLAPNGSDDVKNITIKYVQIKQAFKNSSDNYCMGIFGGSSTTFESNEITHGSASAALKNINITGNDFVNVKEGIYINGTTSSISNNITIHDNDLGSENNQESVILPISLNDVDTFTISQNYIYKLYRVTTAADLASGGINITGESRNGNIFKNDLKDLKRPTENDKIFAGIILSSTYANNNIKVYNNFILDVSAKGNGGGYSNGYGIVADQGSGYKIYHNTVLLTPASNQPNGGYSAAFYVNEGVTGLDVRNNIFVNTQTQATTRRTAISVKNTAANLNNVFAFLDYNNYYSTDRFGYVAVNNGTGNITWAGEPNNENSDYIWLFDTWKTAVGGKDTHSKNVNPSFASATDLHVNAYSAANSGFADAGTNAINTVVPKDIDGQVRKTTTPDMGADEFGPVAMPTAGSSAGIFCDSATTWNGTAWSNGNPASNKDVIFNAAFTKTGGTFEACSIYVLNGAVVKFEGNATANVVHSVNVAETGALTFESGSHLIQQEEDQNSGIVTIKRKGGLLKKLDYTLWSAPVVDYREGVTGGLTNYQSLQEFSPATLANRFYYYNTSNDQYAAYATPAATKFTKGKSVLVRMPNEIFGNTEYNNGNQRVQFEGVFEGIPNTGTQRIALSYIDGKGYNAVGNPYPSPINISAFIQENAINAGTISGTVWLWRKTNNNSLSSYATCTLEGYVNNTAMNPDGTNNNEGNTVLVDPMYITDGGLFNTGQGFIVKALAANKDLIFKNNMRDGSNHTTSFFRTANSGNAEEVLKDGRFWLNIKGAETFSQSLVSYHDYTTDGYDNAYDGTVIISGNLNLYSTLQLEDDTMKLAIQAKSMFTNNDIVPLGFVASAAGTYTFEIDRTEGIFSQGQQIFIKDNMLGVTHNVSDGGFDFTTDAGTFNSRFEVVYEPQGQLGTDVPVVDAKAVIVYRDGNQVKINSSEVISAVTVFDMLGRTLYTQNNIDATEFSTADINTAQQVVLVNITLDNNQVVSKKIMMN